MRVRRLGLPIVTTLAAAAAVVPAFAAGTGPASGTFSAYDYGWTANGNAKSTRLTIAPGGTVSFSYPAGRSEHNADFGRGPHPTSCAQSAGPGSGAVPPLPHVPTGAGWTGACTFDGPGVYTFHCDLHPFMTGTVVVEGPGGSPFAAGPTVHPTQRGTTVRGSVRLSAAARGGRLELDLRASPKSLGRRGSGTVRVGQLIKPNLTPGTVRFAVALGPAARRAELGAGRLTVSLELIVTPPGRAPVSVARRVRLLSSA